MEHMLTKVATHLLIVLAEFAFGKLLHYLWTRQAGTPVPA